ncbi:hypothetical protein FOZ61_009171 [Perkinsus olseni]|uniref:Uncharacterized protein n=1 Tax=Perkinsus olseni TaxID=32597 RepID=A0A7J6M5I5_PEROL|nr:hypothetical protein FOZ61_009171 [Perkinsus olseni]
MDWRRRPPIITNDTNNADGIRRSSEMPAVYHNIIRDGSVHGTGVVTSAPVELRAGCTQAAVTRRTSIHRSPVTVESMPSADLFNSGPIRYTTVRRSPAVPTDLALPGHHHHHNRSTSQSSSVGTAKEQQQQQQPLGGSLGAAEMCRPLSSTLSSTLSSKTGGSNGYRMDATESVASTQATGRFAAWRAAAEAVHTSSSSSSSSSRPGGGNGTTSRSFLSASGYSGGLDASAPHDGSPASTTGEDKLFNAACNCGARHQLLKCRARLEQSAREMERKLRAAMQRRDRATRGLEDVQSLSRELDSARRDARSKHSGWDLALEDARKTAGELKEQDSWLITREGALTRRREETSDLRQRVRSRERQVDELIGETRKEYRRLKGELSAAKTTEREVTSMMEGIRESLSEVRERLVADEEALEAAAHDGEVLKGILEEIPSILCEVESNRTAVTEEIAACRKRLDNHVLEREELDDQRKRLEGRRSKVAARMEGLHVEKQDISALGLRLDELQRKVCASEGSRSSRSSSQSSRGTGSDTMDVQESELTALEREVSANDEKLKTFAEQNSESRRHRDRLEFKLEVSKRQLEEAKVEVQRCRKAVPRPGMVK